MLIAKIEGSSDTMQATPSTVYYAAVFNIEGLKDANPYSDAIKFVYEYVCDMFDAPIAYDAFQVQGSFSTFEKTIKANVTSLSDNTGNGKKWALSLRMVDPDIRYRKWTIDIGIQQSEDGALTLSYVEKYYDSLFGTLVPYRNPQVDTPIFIQQILQAQSFSCAVCSQKMPSHPIEITPETIHAFVDLLYNEARSIPLLVVTNPELINPNALAYSTLGNAVVYYIWDTQELNTLLQPEHRVPSNAFHIIYPWRNGRIGHYTYLADALRRYEGKVLPAVRRAFSENLSSTRQKLLLSVDDIDRERNCLRLARIAEQAEASAATTSRLEATVAERDEQVRRLTQQLEDCQARLNRDLERETEQFMALAEDCLAQMDLVKEQLKEITGLFYQGFCGRPVLVGLPVWPEIAHLCQAAGYLHAMARGNSA